MAETPRNAPIGVFDSGVGGLTVLKDLLRELPEDRYLYFGDTGNVPYGTRPEEEIRALTLAAGELLAKHGVKLIVVACNTASVYGRHDLRAAQPEIPVVVVVPAVKPAAAASRTGQIAVTTTDAAARGAHLQELIEEHAHDVVVHRVPCQRLVTMVEAGQLDGHEVEAAIRGYLTPALEAGIDELVLGCTHFPAMSAAFDRVAGPDVEVIDSGAAVARQVRRILTDWRLLHERDAGPAEASRPLNGQDVFLCSGDPASFSLSASAILGQPVTASYAASGFASVAGMSRTA